MGECVCIFPVGVFREAKRLMGLGIKRRRGTVARRAIVNDEYVEGGV